MRRVVTGFDAEGRSTVLSDGHAPVQFAPGAGGDDRFGLVRRAGSEAPAGPGQGVVNELWSLGSDPAVASDDPTLELQSFLVDVPAGGTKWIITQMGAGAGAPLHSTPTIDYGLVVAGDIELGLETGSVHLYAGDAVVINAVPHSWEAGPQGCIIATVLVGLRNEDR
jgi:quercetin dioxygenase-like cupin family protein